jgi:predicted nucleic acid-binding protein
MAAIVIADASTLIALARVNGLSWLQQLFTEVMLAEVLTGAGGRQIGRTNANALAAKGNAG